jgi:hypothetical protein
MENETNLWTKFSELRLAKRAELESLGVPEKEIRVVIHEIHPFAVKSAVQQANEHAREEESAGATENVDYNFDREDVFTSQWMAEHPDYKGE